MKKQIQGERTNFSNIKELPNGGAMISTTILI
jgi:hypothetical protein